MHLYVGLAFGGAALYLAFNVLTKKEEAPKIKQLDKVPRANQDVIMEKSEALEEDHDNENWSDVDDEDDDDDEDMGSDLDDEDEEMEELMTPEIERAREMLKAAFKDTVVVRDELTGEIGVECLMQIR